MTTYRIDLTPTGPFFFAQELTAELGNRSNYYQQSALFPQQTTLLGMLRHQVLLQEGLIPLGENGNHATARELIGGQSFRANSNTNSFGKINSISPGYLSNDEDVFLLRNREKIIIKERDKTTKEGKIFKPELSFLKPPMKAWRMNENAGNPHFQEIQPYRLSYNKEGQIEHETYTPKHSWFDWLWPITDNEDRKLSKVAYTGEQVGINKKFEGETQTESYFISKYQRLGERKEVWKVKEEDSEEVKELKLKMLCKGGKEFYELGREWKFTFFATTEDDLLKEMEGESRFIIMGKEQSGFMMKVQEENEPDIKDKEGEEVTKVILSSDCYFEDENRLNELALLVSGTTRRFRNMETVVSEDDHQYHRRKPLVSRAFNLLARGSVIYVNNNNLDDLETLIKTTNHFRDIGYNHYFKKPVMLKS